MPEPGCRVWWGKLIYGRKRFCERRYLGVGTTSVWLRQMLANAKVNGTQTSQPDGHQSLVCTMIWSMVVWRWAIHAVGDGRLPLDCSGGCYDQQTKGFVLLKTLGSRAHFRMSTGDWWETMSYFQNHRTFIYLATIRSWLGAWHRIWPQNFSNIL